MARYCWIQRGHRFIIFSLPDWKQVKEVYDEDTASRETKKLNKDIDTYTYYTFIKPEEERLAKMKQKGGEKHGANEVTVPHREGDKGNSPLSGTAPKRTAAKGRTVVPPEVGSRKPRS